MQGINCVDFVILATGVGHGEEYATELVFRVDKRRYIDKFLHGIALKDESRLELAQQDQ